MLEPIIACIGVFATMGSRDVVLNRYDEIHNSSSNIYSFVRECTFKTIAIASI